MPGTYISSAETNLYYLQSRYYSPTIGRFLCADAFTSTGQGIIGNNMFAYCNNNPVNNSDATGEFTDGQIHDFVIEEIVKKDSRELKYKRKDTLIVYETPRKSMWFGFCDLYDPNTGEIWELKKSSRSYTCTTEYATRQLDNYINNGILVSQPDLKKKHPTSFIKPGFFEEIDSMGNRYVISYWDQGNGILRYQYYVIPEKAVLIVASAAFVMGILSVKSEVSNQQSFK